MAVPPWAYRAGGKGHRGLNIHADLFTVVLAGLSADPVTPGQDLRLTWWLHSLPGTAMATATAAVYLDSENALLAQSTAVSIGANGAGVGTGEQVLNVPAPPPGGAVGNNLYMVGQNLLRLEVTDDTGRLFVAYGWLDVIADLPPNWRWNPPSGTPNTSEPPPPQLGLSPRALFHMLINHDYTLSGSLSVAGVRPPGLSPLNYPGTGVQMDGTATFFERGPDDDAPIAIESQAFSLVPGASLNLTFRTLKKDWLWLIPGLWVPNLLEDLKKSYVYSIALTYHDRYGNAFHDVPMQGIQVIAVGVDDEKKGFGDGALAALATGLVIAIFSFGIGASVGAAVAAGLGAKALDPPEPDPRYARLTPVPKRTVRIKGQDACSKLAEFLTDCQHLLDLIHTLDTTINRILGARMMRDLPSDHRQVEALGTISHALSGALADAAEAARLAVAACKNDSRFDADALEPILRSWQASGLPRATVQALVADGVSDEAIAALTASLKHEEVPAAARDVTVSVGRVAAAIAWGAHQALHRASRFRR